MIEINLLPKDFRKGSSALSFGKTGVYLAASAVGVIVILGAITFWQITQLSQLESDIERAHQRAAMLRQDIRVVDALMDVKGKIHRRIQAVEKLDRHRSTWVRILEDVSRNVPEFVWLDEFKERPLAPPPEGKNKKGGKEEEKAQEPSPDQAQPSIRPVEVRGYAFTLNALAATMIRMMRSDYFADVELVNSYDTLYNEAKAYKFELSANVHYLSEEELQNQVAKAAEQSESKSSHASLD